MHERYTDRRAAEIRELDGLRLEIDEAKRIGYIILDRAPLNIVSYQARDQLRILIEELGRDPKVGVIVIRGANGVYTSGGDVRGFLSVPRDGMSNLAWNIAAPERCPKPVICAMEKYAFGVGLELSLACDFRIATRDTLLALPEATIGMIPGSGGSQRVVRLAGLTRAKDMVLMGRRIPAEEAHRWGLITEVVEDGEALTKAIESYAARLNGMSPLVLATLKRVLDSAEDASLPAGFEIEGQAYEKLRDSADYKEGVEAFFEKRKPNYTGK